MAQKKLWNSPELIEAFGYWKRGMAGDEDRELLEAPLEDHHLEDLKSGVRVLMNKRRAKAEYTFTDGAVDRVRQTTSAYIGEIAIPKHRLITASATRISNEGIGLSRIYSTKRSLAELQQMQDLNNLRAENVILDDKDERDRPLDAALQMMLESGNNHDYERRTDVIWQDNEVESAVLQMFPDGHTERRSEELTVADYMTIGHLIEFDKR